MSRSQEFERKERERQLRRKRFHTGFVGLAVLVVALLLWKLHSLLVPIIVGALLAYLFRPLKDRFQVRWLHHELRILLLFVFLGFIIFAAIGGVRKQMPDEKQKLELKVRLKYKLNEKYQQVVDQTKSSPLGGIIAREAGPMMEQFNKLLALAKDERELFLSFRKGLNGQPQIDDRYFEYFQANEAAIAQAAAQPAQGETPHASTMAAARSGEASVRHASMGGHSGLMEELSIWILAPIIFVFLGFDNGQLRRYLIGLVPNRYFELSLTVLDDLDEAIGNYLRGTLIECFLVGLTFTVGLILLGLPLSVSVVIGVVSGLANAIPFLGTVIGLVIGLGYALIAENITPWIPGLNSNDLAIYVMVLVVIAHVLDNVLYQPFVLGSAVNLHPLVVVVAIIGGSLMMGMLGMLLAIPAVVVIKTAVETLFKELKDYRII